MNLILNDTQLPFTSIERRVIGNIARYHRKGGPQYKHYNFKLLSRELKRKVTTLAGILRLADGLDFSHKSIVQSVEAQADFDNVTVQGAVRSEPNSRRVRGEQEKGCIRKILQKESNSDMEAKSNPFNSNRQQPQIETPQSG